MESIVSTFHLDWKIIVAQAVNFSIVFIVLYIFALKPLVKLMAERSEKIVRGLNDAKTNATLLEKTRAEYETALQKARTEAEKIFEIGKQESEHQKQKMLDEAKHEGEKTITAGRKTLEHEKIKIVGKAKQEIVSLALLAVEKILKEKKDLNDL